MTKRKAIECVSLTELKSTERERERKRERETERQRDRENSDDDWTMRSALTALSPSLALSHSV